MEELCKYRAWHKKQKFMFQVTAINFRGSGKVYSVSPNQGETWYLVGDEVELLQYTGLKDFKGKEIYVGDIIEVKLKYYIYKIIKGVVMFDEKLLRFCIETPQEREEFGNLLDYQTIKIIGNIYQNKDLLENVEEDCENKIILGVSSCATCEYDNDGISACWDYKPKNNKENKNE